MKKNDVIHIIGNGDKSVFWNEMNDPSGGRLICNMPPFHVDNVYATVMVDFKMMMALTEGHVNLDMYPWVLGNRPKIWMNDPRQSSFYLKYAQNIREFYLHVPKYCGPVGDPQSATNFNCGHMATHFAATKFRPKEIHMYGFDTILDFNMRSITDVYLSSDRSNTNNYRLINNWRPIWYHLFKEFEDQTRFILHHDHDEMKIPQGKNVEVVIHKTRKQEKLDKKEALQAIESQEILTEEQLSKLNRKQRRVYEAKLRKGKLKARK